MNHENMKMTEVGWIPKDWEVKTISQCTDVVTGATPSTAIAKYWGGNIKWMSSGELNNKIITDVFGRITEEGYNHSGTHMIPENCVLIGLAGQGKTRGTAAYNLIPLCTNQSIASILPNESEFHSLYLYHYIDSQYDALRLLSAGDGGRGGLNKQIILGLQFPLPTSLSEQRRIAQVLSDTDSLIASLSRTIEKKRLVKQGAMQQLLTGKTRLKGFSGEWVEKKLGELGKAYSGNGFPILYQGKTSGNFPFYKVSDFGNTTNDVLLSKANNYINDIDCEQMKCTVFPKGTIVYAKIGAAIFLERKRILQLDSCIDNNMGAFISNEYVYNYYLLYLLKSVKFGDCVGATALPALKSTDLYEITFHIPVDLNEQFAIADILTTMDNEIASLEAELQKYKSLKQGMMQKLLTGQIRLTNSTK